LGKKQNFSRQKELCQENGILIHICFLASTFFYSPNTNIFFIKMLNTNEILLTKMNTVHLCCICAYQLHVN